MCGAHQRCSSDAGCGADAIESGLERGAAGLQGTPQALLSGALAQGDEDLQGKSTTLWHICAA